MDPITMAIMAGSSALSLGTSFIGGQDRLLRRDKAQGDYNLSKKNFTSQDFSNVYANMENPFEDLKVNTGAADFQSKAQSQNLADIMGAGKSAVGGSGIGAFSQMLANQASQNSQAISADLGMQESNIATRQAEGALSIDQMERQGELTSMGMRNEQLGTIFGIDQAELAGSEAAIAQARAARTGMAGEIVGGVASNPNLFA
jgi:hypothetical protein|tara:strand:+ start:3562 stop:4167 length:606 start_codon:yes stop_codon:yes gene_type:complete